MVLDPNDQNRLIGEVLSRTGCPASAADRLDAYAIGVRTAIRSIAPVVSVTVPQIVSGGPNNGDDVQESIE